MFYVAAAPCEGQGLKSGVRLHSPLGLWLGDMTRLRADDTWTRGRVGYVLVCVPYNCLSADADADADAGASLPARRQRGGGGVQVAVALKVTSIVYGGGPAVVLELALTSFSM